MTGSKILMFMSYKLCKNTVVMRKPMTDNGYITIVKNMCAFI